MTAVRLDPATPWLNDPAIGRIFAALDLPDAAPRFVGGCVRDALLGLAAADIDIATPLTPDVVTETLRAAGVAVHPPGIDHGTVEYRVGTGLRVNRAALQLTLANLLRNAVAYTDRGEIRVRYADGVLAVSDTGVGIAPAELPRVFERAFRGANARAGGTGIGLAIVRRVAERFGWRIDADSVPGEGTTGLPSRASRRLSFSSRASRGPGESNWPSVALGLDGRSAAGINPSPGGRMRKSVNSGRRFWGR